MNINKRRNQNKVEHADPKKMKLLKLGDKNNVKASGTSYFPVK